MVLIRLSQCFLITYYFYFITFEKALWDFWACIERKYKHNILINVLLRATFWLKFTYICFSITVLSFVPSRVWIDQHYLQEFFTNFSKVFFEVTDMRYESSSFVPFLILPNVLTKNLQTTNRIHMPFSDSPCVLLTEMSRGHVCVVLPPDLDMHGQYICCLTITIIRYYWL